MSGSERMLVEQPTGCLGFASVTVRQGAGGIGLSAVSFTCRSLDVSRQIPLSVGMFSGEVPDPALQMHQREVAAAAIAEICKLCPGSPHNIVPDDIRGLDPGCEA